MVPSTGEIEMCERRGASHALNRPVRDQLDDDVVNKAAIAAINELSFEQ